jgi:hypothetical protein
MAVALKVLEFSTARELANFCAGGAGAPSGITPPVAQANIISIIFDGASGKYVIFYT